MTALPEPSPQPIVASRPGEVRAVAARCALALGTVGVLGEALLASLLASDTYRVVHVAVRQMIGSATARFHPWVIGDGVIVADDAYLCLTGGQIAASPLQRYAPGHALQAAQVARDCGARRLIVVSPLAALLQLSAGAHAIGSEDELALTGLGFRTVLIVRPTADNAGADSGWINAMLRTAARTVRDIMLPQKLQPMRAQTTAMAIVEAARRTPPGVHVVGAAALATIAGELQQARR